MKNHQMENNDMEIDKQENVDRESPRIVIKTYLTQHSPVFDRLAELKHKGWANKDGDDHFKAKEIKSDNATAKDKKMLFAMMRKIGDEMQEKTQALSLNRENAHVLDLCMAPGGYSAATLKYNPRAMVSGVTLPPTVGGHDLLIRHQKSEPSDKRVKVWFGDITMVADNFIDISRLDLSKHPDQDSLLSRSMPYSSMKFDLVFCDGQVLRSHQPHLQEYRQTCEASRLTLSQLLFATSHIRDGGTLVILLHKPEMAKTFYLLYQLSTFARIQLFKPLTAHRIRGSFYVIAKDVVPGSIEAQSAIRSWQDEWQFLTIDRLESDCTRPKDQYHQTKLSTDIHEILDGWGPEFIRLAEPIWEIQHDALANASWMKFA